MEKTIDLKVNGVHLAFVMGIEPYNKYINEVTMTNKVAPARNLLMRTVTEECKEDLRKILESPSAGVQIAAAVLEEYTPDLEIEVGK